jgi:carotenoid cleavage dioxygenase
MVHGVRLRDGRAEWYRARWVLGDAMAEKLGRPPLPGPRHGPSSARAASTSVGRIGGRLLALQEAGALAVELDEGLDSQRFSDLGGPWPGAVSAHIKSDPETRESHMMIYGPGLPGASHVTLSARGEISRVTPIAGTAGMMVHDLAITATSVLVMDLPTRFDPRVLAEGYNLPYRWDPAYQARIGVVPRNGAGGEVRWHTVGACWVHHPVNAYEDDAGRIVMDVVRHAGFMHHERNGWWEGPTTLDRWTIDPSQDAVRETRLDDASQEFPRVDDRRVGRAHRYAFCAAYGTTHIAPGPLLRHDLARGTCDRHDFGPGRGTAEAVFVPRSADAPEGDGWTISFVYDAATDRSDLVVIDTRDFAGAPAAVVHLPRRVPFGAHGEWFADPS